MQYIIIQMQRFLLPLFFTSHNDLPWQFRQYANNSVYSVNLGQDMRNTWNNETWMDDKSFPRIPSQTDIPRLRTGKVGGQVSNVLWNRNIRIYFPS